MELVAQKCGGLRVRPYGFFLFLPRAGSRFSTRTTHSTPTTPAWTASNRCRTRYGNAAGEACQPSFPRPTTRPWRANPRVTQAKPQPRALRGEGFSAMGPELGTGPISDLRTRRW